MTMNRRQLLQFAAATAAFTASSSALRAGGHGRTGSLSGRRGYNVSGSVEVTKVDGKTVVVLGNDYSFDPSKNPPDIKIGFGDGEKYAKGSKIHEKLTVKQGAASFEVPDGINTDSYGELYIYCERFSVILAVAPLS